MTDETKRARWQLMTYDAWRTVVDKVAAMEAELTAAEKRRDELTDIIRDASAAARLPAAVDGPALVREVRRLRGEVDASTAMPDDRWRRAARALPFAGAFAPPHMDDDMRSRGIPCMDDDMRALMTRCVNAEADVERLTRERDEARAEAQRRTRERDEAIAVLEAGAALLDDEGQAHGAPWWAVTLLDRARRAERERDDARVLATSLKTMTEVLDERDEARADAERLAAELARALPFLVDITEHMQPDDGDTGGFWIDAAAEWHDRAAAVLDAAADPDAILRERDERIMRDTRKVVVSGAVPDGPCSVTYPSIDIVRSVVLDGQPMPDWGDLSRAAQERENDYNACIDLFDQAWPSTEGDGHSGELAPLVHTLIVERDQAIAGDDPRVLALIREREERAKNGAFAAAARRAYYFSETNTHRSLSGQARDDALGFAISRMATERERDDDLVRRERDERLVVLAVEEAEAQAKLRGGAYPPASAVVVDVLGEVTDDVRRLRDERDERMRAEGAAKEGERSRALAKALDEATDCVRSLVPGYGTVEEEAPGWNAWVELLEDPPRRLAPANHRRRRHRSRRDDGGG